MSEQTTSVDATIVPAVAAPTLEATLQQKRMALGLISGCHVLNHLQYSITAVIFPVMMAELGFGLVGLGFLSALSSFVGQGLQVIYGFLSNFFRRTAMLAVGNVVVGATAMAQYFITGYPQLVAARVAIDAGSSPQHPLGSSILSRYYPKARGWALTFHHSAGNLGSFIGPAAASLALLYMDWRAAFVLFGALSLLMGLSLFWVRDHGEAVRGGAGRKAKAGFDAYRQCLKNRNIVVTSLVLMVGAAGRGTGINMVYLVPFFMAQYGISAASGGILLTLLQGAGLVGPLAIAWFSDWIGKRRGVTQITLALSAVTTVMFPHHASMNLLFYVNLLLYGAVVQARGALTQTMIGDFASEELTDAAFSIYYFIGFISGPIWTMIVGYVMQHYGFAPAFYIAAGTYIAGMLLLMFVNEDVKPAKTA
ncbi:MAG TPA: MFS transporter [Candidatus Binatia bacterium]|nr:MFS transporter [Candidatus Binatia bacterium]